MGLIELVAGFAAGWVLIHIGQSVYKYLKGNR